MSARTFAVYATTRDEKGREHQYKITPATESIPDGHTLTAARPAETVRFSSMLSRQSLDNLRKAVRKNRSK